MYRSELYLVVVFNFLFRYSTGLYFHLAEGDKKCFIEEVPSDTMVTSKILLYTSQTAIEIELIIHIFAAHYKIELYDSRSGGFAPPSLGKKQIFEICS